jgi:sulfatase maturation enzyme AslB (radical SAM superfamily)
MEKLNNAIKLPLMGLYGTFSNLNMEYAIRITDFCNLNCAYCYARTENPQKMSLETLTRVLNEVAASCEGQITVGLVVNQPQWDMIFLNQLKIFYLL